jgi:two-component system response regulator VicR
MKKEDPLYTTHEIADLIQMDQSTIAKWIDKGVLKGFKTPGGHRRAFKSELLAFIKEYKLPFQL